MRPLIIILALALAGCAKEPPSPVVKPCGVIVDSLLDVKGKTKADNYRIDRHFERGIGAGCWDRSGVLR